MTDVLDRITSLMTCLAANRHAGHRLGDIAADCGLPPATCSRLLKRLVVLGWVNQDRNRGQYQLGPRTFALAHGEPYRAHLVDAARTVFPDLAGWTRDSGVGLSVLVGRRRIFLYGIDGFGQILMPVAHSTDLFASPSGRVLLAHLGSTAVHRMVDALGLPSREVWAGVSSREALLAALRQIRRAGAAWSDRLPGGMAGVAVRVPDGCGGWAALGAWRPRELFDASLIDAVRAGGLRLGNRR
jgi:DNA-binding IclR family transcriptional regulator